MHYPNNDQIEATCHCETGKAIWSWNGPNATICGDGFEGEIKIGESSFKELDFCYLLDNIDRTLGITYKYAPAVQLPPVLYRIHTEYHPHGKDTINPFIIIQILTISKTGKVTFTVYYRPENTDLKHEEARAKNISTLYYSDRQYQMDFFSKLRQFIVLPD